MRAGVRRSARALFVALVLAATTATATVLPTGAYYTSSKTVAGNTASAATVSIGGLGADAATTQPMTVSNLLPLTPAQVDDASYGAFLDLKVRNLGSVPIDWQVSLLDIAPRDSAFARAVRVRVSTDAGRSWGPTTSLLDLGPVRGAALAPRAADGSGGTTGVRMRFWLPSDAGDDLQGAVLTFTSEAKAIQAGIPLGAA